MLRICHAGHLCANLCSVLLAHRMLVLLDGQIAGPPHVPNICFFRTRPVGPSISNQPWLSCPARTITHFPHSTTRIPTSQATHTMPSSTALLQFPFHSTNQSPPHRAPHQAPNHNYLEPSPTPTNHPATKLAPTPTPNLPNRPTTNHPTTNHPTKPHTNHQPLTIQPSESMLGSLGWVWFWVDVMEVWAGGDRMEEEVVICWVWGIGCDGCGHGCPVSQQLFSMGSQICRSIQCACAASSLQSADMRPGYIAVAGCAQ